MNGRTHPELRVLSGHSSAVPFYFKSADSHLFAWLHQPPAQFTSKLGVVICSPYGYESICAHRSVRTFAESIAGIGIPVLRFDYRSTGDSSEIDENADHVALWTQDVISAIRELRSCAGVDRICLLGIRLGALLASLAAAEPGLVESLFLIGPVISGRRFVRELRTTQLAGMALSGEPVSQPASGTGGTKTLEAGGFSFSEATLNSLTNVDLLAAPAPAVRSITILDNDKLPSAKRWVEALATTNIKVDYKLLPGLIEMAMTAPQFATVPRAMVDLVCQSLSSVASITETGTEGRSATGNHLGAEASVTRLSSLPLAASSQFPGISLTERPVCISSDVALFGIVTEPRRDEKRRRAVILLNPGADFHIGASRMYVSLARRWSASGYFVLRLDFAGIGDSATRPGNIDDEVFPAEAIDDIRQAVAFMRSRYGISEMTLAGLCSGGYHALRAAVAGVAVNRILLVNPQNYFWEKGMTLEDVQLAEVAHNPSLYRRRLFSFDAWRRIFAGQVDLKRIALIYLQRARLAGESQMRSLARRLRIRLRQDLGRELEDIVAAGIHITFVFARGEPGIELLRLQALATPHSLGEGCRIRIVDSGDHIFSRREPRSLMENVLSEELFTRANHAREPALSASPTEIREAS